MRKEPDRTEAGIHKGSVPSRDSTVRAYDRLSGFYDVLTAGAERKLRNEGVSLLGVRRGERVLEIGCGTGDGLIELAACAGKEGHVYGADVSPGMLKVAERKISVSPFAESISLIQADAVSLPIGDSSIDAVFLSFTLELFTDEEIRVVLSECLRVLKENGRICVVSISEKGTETAGKKIYKWAHEMFPVYVDCRPIRSSEHLRKSGFILVREVSRTLYSIPVDIVVGTRKGDECVTQNDLLPREPSIHPIS